MTTDLNKYDPNVLPGADVLARQRYAIIVSDWNSEITFAMKEGALQAFRKHGVDDDHLFVKHVPGTVELVYAARKVIEQVKPDAVVVIGCVIKGATPHFDYVCQAVTQGVTILNAEGKCPVIFSVLTTLDKQQAVERAGGMLGNKGIEGAVTAMRMANL